MSAVAITGFGLHGGLGDADETAEALALGRSAIIPFRPETAGFPELMAAPARAFDLDAFVPDRKQVKYMSPATQLAVLAAGRALHDAFLLDDAARRAEAALFVATGPIAFDLSSLLRAALACRTTEGGFDLQRMGTDGLRLCHPLLPFKMLLNMPLALVSISFGIKGESFAVYPGADQAGVALETAWRGVRNGRFVRALVGASVQGLSPVPLAAALRRGRAGRGDVARDGAPDGAGAIADMGAFLLLEAEAAAKERGARILGWLEQPMMCRPETRDPAAAADVWGSPAPAAVAITGSLTPGELERLRSAAAAGRASAPCCYSWDERLGYAGPASLVAAIGLVLRATPGRDEAAATPPDETAVVAWAPDEALFACRVRRAGAVV